MDDKSPNTFWLIRDTTNNIRGPFKHQEMVTLLKKNQLRGKTEISRSHSYWFTVEEKSELGRFFPELGLPAPEAPTQMTGTLTENHTGEREVEITQFTKSPTRKELKESDGSEAGSTMGKSPVAEPGSGNEIQWLNDEAAEEFGDFETVTMPVMSQDEVKTEEIPSPDVTKPSPSPSAKSAEEMLRRATVKADTLPSEHKDFQGSRPKPINTIFRAPDKPAQAQAPSAVVTLPVEAPDAHVNIIPTEGEEIQRGRRNRVFLVVAAVALIAAGVAAFLLLPKDTKGVGALSSPPKGGKSAKSRGSVDTQLRKALLLYDLEEAKDALNEMELRPDRKSDPVVTIAQAVVKQEFVFDSEGAAASLQLAKSVNRDAALAAQIENLVAIYSFQKDGAASIESFRRLVSGSPGDAVLKYNLGLAYLREGKTKDSLQVMIPLTSSLGEDDPLLADAAVALGWAQELDAKGEGTHSEAAFLRALAADGSSSKARLGLAINRLRRKGFRDSENDFRMFVDGAPELDPPTRVANFRKMQDFEFYTFVRGRIRELNLDGPMGSKPSPLIMAVDAILSCLQNRTGEAGKILESALSAAPGDINLLKAMGYLRWKEGRYADLVDLLKEVPKEKGGFALSLLLGKAYLKLDRRPQAYKSFEYMAAASPQRSEGWSLMGELLLQDGKEQEARNKFQTAIRKDALDLVALRGLHQLGQADIFTPELLRNLPF